MDCSVTIVTNGKSVTQSLKRLWGSKYALTFPIQSSAGQKNIRVVMQVDKNKISGLYQIDGSEVGLPQQRLSKLQDGFTTSWPPANGLTITVYLSGDGVEVVKQAVNGQWWGVFKDSNNCKCTVVGPSATKPTPPKKTDIYAYYRYKDTAKRGLSQCEKSLPPRCQK